MKNLSMLFFFSFICLAEDTTEEVDCDQLLLKKHRDAIVFFLAEDDLSQAPPEQHHEAQERMDQAIENFDQTALEYSKSCRPPEEEATSKYKITPPH